MKGCLAEQYSMDKLPTTHTPTKKEEQFLMTLGPKDLELHKLAVQLLQTSYRPEWSHMYRKAQKAAATPAKN
jgi:hypothetical protein